MTFEKYLFWNHWNPVLQKNSRNQYTHSRGSPRLIVHRKKLRTFRKTSLDWVFSAHLNFGKRIPFNSDWYVFHPWFQQRSKIYFSVGVKLLFDTSLSVLISLVEYLAFRYSSSKCGNSALLCKAEYFWCYFSVSKQRVIHKSPFLIHPIFFCFFGSALHSVRAWILPWNTCCSPYWVQSIVSENNPAKVPLNLLHESNSYTVLHALLLKWSQAICPLRKTWWLRVDTILWEDFFSNSSCYSAPQLTLKAPGATTWSLHSNLNKYTSLKLFNKDFALILQLKIESDWGKVSLCLCAWYFRDRCVVSANIPQK